MTAFYIIISLTAVIMLILFIPADCIIEFACNNESSRGAVVIKYLFMKFTIFPTEKKLEKAAGEVEKDAEREEPSEDKKDVWGLIKFGKTVYSELKKDILRIIKHFFRYTICVKELNISSHFGTGDPMYTGIVAGAANAAVYNAVSVIDRHMTLDKWKVSMMPDFDNACFEAGVYLKIRTRVASVLWLGIMAAVLLIRIKRINRRMNRNG
ncbi:MAG: DUF2953 domain-containing protein [Clostridia bacterium]|nr:DUF2953 domain-containing protein [Clostridia bacterium]